MTDEEIKERATKKSLQYNTQYSEDFDLKRLLDNSDNCIQIDRLIHLLREKAYRDGYLAGAKDNTPQWHYPSRGEFPEHEKDILGYWIGAGFCVGWYNEKQDLWLKNPLHSEWLIQPDAWQYLPEPPKEM